MHRAGGTIIAGQEYGMSDATQGLTRLDLRDQEVIDMEVARRLQEEEIMVSPPVPISPGQASPS